jgi:hypothetical protein
MRSWPDIPLFLLRGIMARRSRAVLEFLHRAGKPRETVPISSAAVTKAWPPARRLATASADAKRSQGLPEQGRRMDRVYATGVSRQTCLQACPKIQRSGALVLLHSKPELL